MYVQLVEPNLWVTGRVGYCLEYARLAFAAPVVEGSATEAADQAQFKHYDQNFPDYPVPVFWDYRAWIDGVYANWGHVAIHMPDGSIWSSPYAVEGHVVYPSMGAMKDAYGLGEYRFWTEDISGVRVIKEKNMENINSGDTDNLYIALHRSRPTQRETDDYYRWSQMATKEDKEQFWYATVIRGIEDRNTQIDKLTADLNTEKAKTTKCTPEERQLLDLLKKVV